MGLAQHQAEDAAYRAIGRYVVAFSQLVFFMRHLMSVRLRRPEDSLNPMRLAFGAAEAYPIANSFFAICIDIGELEGADRKIARALRKKVIDVIEQRNDIAHGDWWVGLLYDEQGNPEPPTLARTKPARTEKPYTAEHVPVSDLLIRADELFDLTGDVCDFGRVAFHLHWTGELLDPGIRVRDVFRFEGPEKDRRLVRYGPRVNDIIKRPPA